MELTNYKKATPIIKQIDELDVQRDTVAKTNQIKLEMQGATVLINPQQFGDEGMATVRNAILKVLDTKSESLKKELEKL